MNAPTPETAAHANRPPAAAETPTPSSDPAPAFADKLVVVCFLIGLALFVLISVLDLLSNLVRY